MRARKRVCSPKTRVSGVFESESRALIPPRETDDGYHVRPGIAQREKTAAPVARLTGRVYVGVLGCWLLVFAASLILYWPGLRGGYFSDDLLFFFSSPPAHLYDYFAIRGAAAHAFRPLEAIILTLIQQRFWFNTLPIHLLSVGAHAGLVCVVCLAARRLALRPAEIVLAGAFMLVTQVGAPAVLGNDTMSQVASAFFGTLSALLLYIGWLGGVKAHTKKIPLKWITMSVVAYAIALFFKETALGFFLVALLMILLIALSNETSWPARIKTAFLLALPYGVASVLYGLARLHAGGAVSESGSYRIQFGFNIARNIAEFSLAALGPMSTVDGAVAVALHRTPQLALEAFGWIVVVTVMLAGIVVSGRVAVCLWLAVAALASLFPAYLLTHVSELYLYNAMPFLALVLGIAFGSLYYRGRHLRTLALLCAALLIGAQIYADRQKAQLMALNGRRAAVIMAGIEQYLHTLPRDSQILLVNPPGRGPEYSVFLLQGFDVVDIGTMRIGPIFGRPDVRVQVVEEAQVQGLEQRDNRLLLALAANGGVEPYRP
jgi:hypothetical protein